MCLNVEMIQARKKKNTNSFIQIEFKLVSSLNNPVKNNYLHLQSLYKNIVLVSLEFCVISITFVLIISWFNTECTKHFM